MIPANKIRISIASDYAGMEAGAFDFYYGYEYGKNENGEVWGFRAKKNGKVIFEYPVDQGRFEVAEQLLEGIGKYLASLP